MTLINISLGALCTTSLTQADQKILFSLSTWLIFRYIEGELYVHSAGVFPLLSAGFDN